MKIKSCTALLHAASIRGTLVGLWYVLNFISCKTLYGVLSLPRVPEVFLACGEHFRCWPKAEATSGHCKGLTETGNRDRKVSGTQGILSHTCAIILALCDLIDLCLWSKGYILPGVNAKEGDSRF